MNRSSTSIPAPEPAEELRTGIAARLPRENPSPVMCLERGRVLSFANPQAHKVLARWGIRLGHKVPGDISRTAVRALAENKRHARELSVGHRDFSVSFVPNRRAGYVNLYFSDITERRRAEAALRRAHDELEQRVRTRTRELSRANNLLRKEIATRERTRQALHETTERLRLMIESTRDYAIIMLDAQGRVATWNSGAAHIKGYAAKEILGQHFSRFYPRSQLRQGWPQRLLKIARTTGRAEDEGWRVRKDGSQFWASVIITAIRDPNGRLRGFLKVTRDMTDRKRAEDAVRESEARIQAILDNSPAMIFLKDPRGRYLHANRRFQQAFHYTLEQILGKTDAELFPQIQAEVFRGNDLKVLRGGKSQIFDEIALHDDGPHASIVTKFPIQNAKGSICAIGGIVTDITERRRVEEALRRSERDLADFFQQSPLGLLWVGPRGQIQRINQAGLELLRHQRTTLLNRSIRQFCAEPQQLTEILQRLDRGEVVRNLHLSMRRADGAIRRLLVDANGLWEQGRLIYSRWFMRDITRRLELEREVLLAGERERQRIGQELHDDLCQQLTGIEFLSQTLAGQLAGRANADANRAREIARMVRQSITYTRELSHGLSPVEWESTGLVGALQDLAGRTRKLFNVDCRFRHRKGDLNGNRDLGIHLYRIAQEAVANAIKHRHATHLEISLTRNSRQLVLAVKDDGVRIPTTNQMLKGMGLHVMQYRAGAIGGTLVVQRKPAGGTDVVCTVRHVEPKNATKPTL